MARRPADMQAPTQVGAQAEQPQTGPEADPMPERSEEGLPVGSTGSGDRLIRNSARAPAPGDGTGAFRTTCLFSHMRHDDPLLLPGEPGVAHLHTFFGNTLASADSTAESLLQSGNSTCRGGTIDRSAYWVPTLLDAAGAPVVPEPAQIYYRSGYDSVAARDIRPFPSGLRMIAGDPDAVDTQYVAHWHCNRTPGEREGSIPECQSGDLLVMTIEFPQCWNGRDVDAPDHRSHMAYTEDGACPASHPVAIPEVIFNISYRVEAEGTIGYRLDSDRYSAGKPGGFSAHGDWFDAWDPALVEVFVAGCINPALDCHSHLLGDGRETYFLAKDSTTGDEL